MDPKPAVNWYRTRRHYSVNLREVKPLTGMEGTSLCGSGVWDEEGINDALKNYRATDYGRKRIDISSIPECKLCRKALDKREK